MYKSAAVFLIVFLLFTSYALSIATFEIQETEKLSLKPKTTDPDADDISTIYRPPLNENGEWQTSYGDAGEYKTAIIVSDGMTNVSQDILIIVKKKEEPPKIHSISPEQDSLAINEAESINFKISASDLNKDNLIYDWFLNEEKVNYGNEYEYNATYKDAGAHKISVFVSDGAASASKEWSVNVANVDVEKLLDEIEDVAAAENDVVRLKLPNFKKHGLEHSISEPLGNKNEWKTGYKDAGSYEINIHAEGKGFSGDKIVNVVVNDLDRPIVFDKIGNRALNENEELKITLNANDPDDDEITYSASNLPQGAEFDDKVFTWKPGYDAVRKEGFVAALMDRFRVLSKNFQIQFAASSNDKKTVQNVVITVKDVNSAPVIEDMETITISEGETLSIVPKAYDLDNDKITLSYSGFINTGSFKSGFDDAGTYYVKITAGDGLLETTKFVQVNINQTNRAPIFGKIKDIKAREGDNIAVLLNSHDPDGDEITYSIDNPPNGSLLKGNAFVWTISHDTTSKKEAKKYDIVFAASDGRIQTRQIAKVEIAYKNRAPKIVDASKSIAARVNEPVLLFVRAIDEDGDELTYKWEFGFLEKYKATATHQRTFATKGTKVVNVIVSDGVNEAKQVIKVNVV
ncbi:MAG: PKD domain-containing protein [Nanoarchaeota archaeon]